MKKTDATKEPLTPLGEDILIASISDIHLGKTPNSAHLYEELKDVFLKWCLENKPDIVVVAGDLTDRKLHMNSEAAKFANFFMHDLYELSRAGTTVLIVHGTASHDNFQILSYSHYVSEKFRMYTKATVDFVGTLKLLILPEEYVINPAEYYKPFLITETKYDFCFGHGMFKHAGGYATDSGGTHSKSAIFAAEQFDTIIKGYVSFGHIHTSVKKGKVIYNGSFSRYNFGEEEDKGFYAYRYKTPDPFSSGSYKYTFIKNDKAPKYSSFIFKKEGSKITVETPGFHPDFKKEVLKTFTEKAEDKAIEYLNELSSTIDNVRILPQMDSDDVFYQTLLAVIRQFSNVRVNNKLIERDITKVEENKESEDQKKDREKREKYKGMDFLEVTKKYAFEEFNEILDNQTIEKAMKNIS